MIKILVKIVLVLSFFCSSIPYIFSETIFLSINDYLDLALENNFELRVAKLTYLRKQALLNLQNEVLKPQFSITSDPLYGFSNSRLLFEDKLVDYYSHTSNIGLAFSSIIPTGGTISLSLFDSIIFGTMDDIFINNPVFSLGFSQPLFVNGGFLNTRGYKAEVMAIDLNCEMVHLEMIHSTNEQILELVRDYYTVLIYERKLRSLKQKINVYNRELELFAIQREQGSLSVTDYWKKELEVKDLEREAFDQEFILSVTKRKLSSLIGLSTDQLNITLEDTIPVFELPEENLVEENLLYRIGNLNAQLNYLAIQTEMKDYVPTLGFDLSIKPQYSVLHSGSEKFTESVTNLWGSDSWIEYSGSIIFSLPVSSMKQGQLKRITLIREAEIRKLELEETRSTLSDEKSELFDKIIYLKEKEQFLSEQLEYFIKRKSEKEKFFQIDSTSSLEVKIAEVDVNSEKIELFSNSVEKFLSILELHNLNGNSIYNLF